MLRICFGHFAAALLNLGGAMDSCLDGKLDKAADCPHASRVRARNANDLRERICSNCLPSSGGIAGEPVE